MQNLSEICQVIKKNRLKIPVQDFPSGVAQITLFDAQDVEQCERLVFINPQKQMRIAVQTDKEKYQPREKVTVEIAATDENNLPLEANLSLAVTDDNLLSFADDKQGEILSKLLLEPDVTGKIHEPNFYFDANKEKAQQALDCLLMTQGWRRFTWEEIRENVPFEPEFEAEESGVIRGIVYEMVEGSSDWKVLPDAIVETGRCTQSFQGTKQGNLTIPLNESGQFSIEVPLTKINSSYSHLDVKHCNMMSVRLEATDLEGEKVLGVDYQFEGLKAISKSETKNRVWLTFDHKYLDENKVKLKF